MDLSGQNQSCPSLPDYPGAAYGSVAAFINSRVLVCGGRIEVPSDDYASDCYAGNFQVYLKQITINNSYSYDMSENNNYLCCRFKNAF